MAYLVNVYILCEDFMIYCLTQPSQLGKLYLVFALTYTEVGDLEMILKCCSDKLMFYNQMHVII